MALLRGMTALRAALGAVGGGLEGYAQFQAMEQKRKMEEEAARRAELGMLISSKQVRLRPVSRAGGGESVGAVESPPPVAADSTLSRALQIGTEAAPSRQATVPTPRTTPQKTALQVRREALQDLQSAFDAYAVPGEANPWDPTEQVTPEKVTSAKAEIDKYIRALEVQATTDPSLRQAATNLEQERKAGYDFYRQMRSQQFGQELSEEPMRPLIASANIIDALRQEGEQRRAMAVPGAQAAPTGPITDRGVATPQPPARPAGRPPVTSVGRVTLGGQEFDLLPALTPEEKKAQEDAEFDRAIAGLSPEEQDIARMSRLLPSGVFEAIRKTRETKAEYQKAERMADLYVKTYVDAKGQPIPRDQALAAALNQKTPIDMGFIEKPMSNAEKIRISLDTARFNLSQKEYDLRLREQNRRESDSQRRRESMPVGAQRRLEGLDSGVLLVGDVREMLKSAPESIGPVKGRVFSSVLDAADKKGVAIRAAIESMAGEIRNQRFGAALTASEAKFAEQFLPSAKDSYETAMSKLDQLDRYLETKRKGVFMTYQQEYRPIYAPTGASPAAGGAANPYR